MVKIICDEENELLKTKDFKATAFRGVVEINGDKELCAHQLAMVLAQLLKTDGEFADLVLDYLGELVNGESD